MLRRSGPLSMAPSQLGIFAKSDPAVATADLEYHVQPLSTDRLGEPLHRYPAVTVSVCNLRPESRGTVHVAGPELAAAPEIRPNYLSTAGDRIVATNSIRHARRLMEAGAIRKYRPQEMLPGTQFQSDEDLIRRVGDIATTIFHPVGTCKMVAATRWPSSTRSCGCTDFRNCGSPTPQSCRRSSRATPIRR